MIEYRHNAMLGLTAAMPDGINAWRPVPQLTTQNELVRFLPMPLIGQSNDHQDVTRHLKRYRRLPRKPIYVAVSQEEASGVVDRNRIVHL